MVDIERAERIANEVKSGQRVIHLILKDLVSDEPFMTVVLTSDIDDGVFDGYLQKACSIDEFKEWVKTSNHKYNNKIRAMIASFL